MLNFHPIKCTCSTQSSPYVAGSYVCIVGNKNGKVKSRRAILDVQGLYITPFIDWYLTSILCSAVKCPTNISIDNGYVSFNENETLATYRCAYGFRLVGSASATCKEDRTWSLPPPKCAGMILSIIFTDLYDYLLNIILYNN